MTISSDSDIGNESIIVSNNAVVTISNVMLKGTEFGKAGSGIINSATLTLINSTVSGYVAFSDSPSNSQGGGITNSGTLTLINSTVVGNFSAGYTGGGGILNFKSGVLTMTNSAITGNKTSGNGGGVLTCGTLTLTDSTIAGNSAAGGSGIYNCGMLTLTNSTISGNTSYENGGGISNEGTNTQVAITFCTIYGNRAGSRGGGIFNGAGNKQLVMSNSIVAGNTAFADPDIAGTLTSNGYNLVQDTSGAIFNPNKQHATDVAVAPHTDVRIDSQLSGLIPQTHALRPGSPAIDKIPLAACYVNTISTDQRGVKRPDGHEDTCDIGAYEYTD